MMVFALVGNPNSGKTTLFNRLTGASQHVGNFPGVTVHKKEGIIKGTRITLVDLPGTYSLSAYTQEEIATRDFLASAKIDGIINIVDATNLERNLFLTLQLMEMGVSVIIALNMMDEADRSGKKINLEKMQTLLKVPVIPITATKKRGLDKLIGIVIDYGAKTNVLNREKIRGIKNRTVFDTREAHDINKEAKIAASKYKQIEKICKLAISNEKENILKKKSIMIDNIILNKYFAFPIFLVSMASIFYIVFGEFGQFINKGFNIVVVDRIIEEVRTVLTDYEVNSMLYELIINGLLFGVGSVLSFLPTIVMLFFLLSLMEDSGYIARVVFIMDKVLKKIGLSGKSVIPIIIGFGCSVPAIMASRTFSSDKEKKKTIMMMLFISCSAKLPIYIMFADAFFPKYRTLFILLIYIFCIMTGILSQLVLKTFILKEDSTAFLMEIPNYRRPSFYNSWILMREKVKEFILKAFTVVMLSALIIWTFISFDLNLNIAQNSAESILAYIGRKISPVFEPLGFGNWRASTALVTGLAAKETIISTLVVVTGKTILELPETLKELFTPLQAVSFIVFVSLYTPCIAVMATLKKEFGSVVVIVCYQFFVAWIASFVFYNIVGEGIARIF